MLLQLQAYFADERTESLVFMAFGLVAVLLAALTLWRVRDPLFRGMAVPVLVVGLIQLGVGYVIHARTDAQVAALSAQLQNEPAAFKAQELARMKTVRTSFAVYKGIEGTFIIVGLGLALMRNARRFWRGFGLGMLLQGALMLPADLIAEDRAAEYVRQIEALP
ncbi:MAG: hypothetical protein M9915_06800 [Rhizobacter sp.]|nr:hypothetical protein [Rhizobacter sp.]